MLVYLVFAAMIAMAVYVLFVKGPRDDGRVNATNANVAASLGLSAREDGSWTGTVEGLDVRLVDSLSSVKNSMELFSYTPPTNESPLRNAAVTIEVRSAPADLAIGPRAPLVRGVEQTGDEEFDRVFGVRSGCASTTSYLSDRRRALLIGQPAIYLSEGRIVKRVGQPDAADQLSAIREFLALAQQLDDA